MRKLFSLRPLEKTIFSQAASSSGSSGQPKEKEVDELCTLRVSLAQLCGDDWKQRGQGEAKLLMHCSSGEVWFVMRDEQSMKVIAQFRVNDDCDLNTTGSSGRSLFCSPTVVSDGERSHVFYTLRFLPRSLPSSSRVLLTRRRCGSAVVLAESAFGVRGLASGPLLGAMSSGGSRLRVCGSR